MVKWLLVVAKTSVWDHSLGRCILLYLGSIIQLRERYYTIIQYVNKYLRILV